MRRYDGSDPPPPFDAPSDEPRACRTGRHGAARPRSLGERSAARAAARRPGLSVAQEGVRAGAVAAASVAVALGVADVRLGEPLMTPALFGYGVERALGLRTLADSMPAAVAGCTALELVASVALAAVAAALVRRVRRGGVLLPVLVLLVAVVALCLAAVGAAVTRTDPLVADAATRLVGANALGWLFAAGRLWYGHAGLAVPGADGVRGAELRPTH